MFNIYKIHRCSCGDVWVVLADQLNDAYRYEESEAWFQKSKCMAKHYIHDNCLEVK